MAKTKHEITKTDKGYSVLDPTRSLFFPQAELLAVGCRNCVWKLNAQCPYDFKDKEQNEEGICVELVDFLASLATKDGSITGILEKFHIYKARLQEAEDYRDYLELTKKIRQTEDQIDLKTATPEEKKQYNDLKMDHTAAKLWWMKLNQHVIMSMQKVRDREAKSFDAGKAPGIFSAKTINFNIQKPEDAKQLDQK